MQNQVKKRLNSQCFYRGRTCFLTLFLFSGILFSLRPDAFAGTGSLAGRGVHTYRHALIVSASSEASDIGVRILKKGGNAIDAAVAVQFALAVVYPEAGNIGGGGFMVIRTKKGLINSLDFREEAPASASRNMFLDAKGQVIDRASTEGHLASGIPGSVAGMVEAHSIYGKLKWADLVQPAVDLAKNGFRISRRFAESLNHINPVLVRLNGKGEELIGNGVWKEGDRLVQKELAHTLELIRDQGRRGFYEGETAKKILTEINKEKPLLGVEDLRGYQAKWRPCLTADYKGYKIITMGPPSSGGTALIQLLHSTADLPLKSLGWNSARSVHYMTEAERRVYADRSYYMGDPDYVEMPLKTLLSDSYNHQRMQGVGDQAGNSTQIQAGMIPGFERMQTHIHTEKKETTHFSILDADGNAVSVTTTLNGGFGSGVIVSGAGFLLNNEMDDFSIKPGIANMFGLLGGEANAIQPLKRMLSSMTPTIIEKNGKVFMVLGTPGGATIITTVYQTILNVINYSMSMQQAVDAGRVHSQWLPDEIQYEPEALRPSTQDSLKKMGYVLRVSEPIGRTDAILSQDNGRLQAGADKRGEDSASGY